MRTEHLEVLVEEPSMEAFLAEVLPRMLDGRASFALHVHQGKSDLLGKLAGRLRGYAKWLPEVARIVVVLDRDNANCIALKNKLENEARVAGLQSRTRAGNSSWQVVNRLAIEELEAWFFGEWLAVCEAYPRVSATVPKKSGFGNSDAIAGGTWEAFERILKNAGYFSGGLRKVEAAITIGKRFDPNRATSASFVSFREAILEAIA